jgi:spore maturation protein CgeB
MRSSAASDVYKRQSYTAKIDWNVINAYKKSNNLHVGLTASIEEYGNTPLNQRLSWAKSVGIDFYYSFRAQEYFNSRTEYKPFFDFGYKILSVEFGANPILYFPLPIINKDLDYVFLASSNGDKQKRYFKWLSNLVYKHIGFIDGPGWHKIDRWASQPTHKFLYARAKIGINLHIDDSIDWASELNERTYILAACGVPQLVDNAKLLTNRFSNDSMFIATNPKEYEELFDFMLNNPKECEKRALKSLEEVYEKHTTLHRASSFINQLKGSI